MAGESPGALGTPGPRVSDSKAALGPCRGEILPQPSQGCKAPGSEPPGAGGGPAN